MRRAEPKVAAEDDGQDDGGPSMVKWRSRSEGGWIQVKRSGIVRN